MLSLLFCIPFCCLGQDVRTDCIIYLSMLQPLNCMFSGHLIQRPYQTDIFRIHFTICQNKAGTKHHYNNVYASNSDHCSSTWPYFTYRMTLSFLSQNSPIFKSAINSAIRWDFSSQNLQNLDPWYKRIYILSDCFGK